MWNDHEAAGPLYVVGIGASTSDLEAIRDLLAPARSDAPVAYVMVQHVDPNHESLAADLLYRAPDLTVIQARDGEDGATLPEVPDDLREAVFALIREVTPAPPVSRDRAPSAPIAGEDFAPPVPSESQAQLQVPQLRATIKDLETANQKLTSLNEELQSTNAKLAAVNADLKSKLNDLSGANSDLHNFFESTALAVVTVESDMKIRSFTPAARQVFAIHELDRGRPLGELPGTLEDFAEIQATTRAVIDSGEPTELQVLARGGTPVWLLTISPYRLPSGAISGASLVFSEITEAVRLQDDLAVEGERLRLALEIAQIGMWEMAPDRQMLEIDTRIAEFYGLDRGGWQPTELFYDSMETADRRRVAAAIDRALTRGECFDAMFKITAPDGSRRYLRGMGQVRPSPTAGGQQRLIGVNLDVTAEVEAAQMRELMLREMNHRVKNLFSIISGMLRLAARSAETPKALVDDVGRRISALARSHDLTLGGHDGTPLEEVVQATIAPHVEGQLVAISGPPVLVSTAQLTSLALILHEWATNSAKYGVLGPSPGKLQVSWRIDRREGGENPAQVVLEWNEFFDRALSKSSKAASEGFGTTLVNLSAAQLRGRVEVEASETRRTNRLSYDTDERGSEQG